MSHDQRQIAEAMVCEHGNRAGYIALARSADAWLRHDPEQRTYWRGVVAAIAELQPNVFSLDNRRYH